MAITQHQLDIKSALIQDSYQALEKEIIERLIKRLNAKTVAELNNDNIFQWQLEKLQQLKLLNLKTIAELAQQTANITKAQLEELIIKDGFETNVEANQDLANMAGVPVKPWTNLDEVLHQYFDSSWLSFDNHVNQTLVSTNYAQNWIAQKYQQVLNDVVAKTLTGFTTPKQALKSAIYEMVSKGVMTEFTDKAGRPWSLERYVRTVIKATTSNVYNDLRTERGIKEYGIVTALMSSHMAAREACSHIQGGFVLMVPKTQAPEEYQSLPSIYDYGYGLPEGTRGINCNHRFYSMLPMDNTGIPEPPTPKQAQENANIVAQQRRMEVAIRDAKKKLIAAEVMGDEVDTEYFKNLVRKRQGALRQLIDDNNTLLHRDYSREAAYSGATQSDLLAQSQTMAKAEAEYKNIKTAFGDTAPSSLADFRRLSYNDNNEARVYKTIMNSTKSNVQSPNQKQASIRSYQQFKKDGVLLSDHAVEQYQHRMRHEKTGKLIFNYQSVLQSAQQPANYSSGDRLIKYYGKVALITEKSGKVVSLYHVNKARKKWEPIE